MLGLIDTNPYRYASGYLDTAAGLYQFGQRYYQPTLGRWTQQDTLNMIGDPERQPVCFRGVETLWTGWTWVAPPSWIRR